MAQGPMRTEVTSVRHREVFLASGVCLEALSKCCLAVAQSIHVAPGKPCQIDAGSLGPELNIHVDDERQSCTNGLHNRLIEAGGAREGGAENAKIVPLFDEALQKGT